MATEQESTEVVVRVWLRAGTDRDSFSGLVSKALSASPAVELVVVDTSEGLLAQESTTTTPLPGFGLSLEETKRLYVRFGPRPDERLRLAKQQHSMLAMLMTPGTPIIRGSKALLDRLRAFDGEHWGWCDVGSATKCYSSLADVLDKTQCRLTKKRGTYGFLSAIVPAGRRKRLGKVTIDEV